MLIKYLKTFLFCPIICGVKELRHIMRYFLKKSIPSKKGLYLQIYRTNYVPGKGNQNRSYKALGYVSDLKAKGIADPIAWAKGQIGELNGDHALAKERQIGDSSTSKNAGYFLAKAMFDALGKGFDRDLNIVARLHKSQYDFATFLKTLTYAQIVDPGSKLKVFRDVIPNLYGAESYTYDQILDGVNFIGRDFHKYVEVLNHFIAKKWERRLGVGYFDCTNYYFEIDGEDEWRRKGPSKEGRHDPIIGQSLLLDADMVPLDMELYPGNESEKPYLRQRIEDMRSRNGVEGRVIQVADKGLNCARNVYAAVKEADDGYIFSKSVHGRNLSEAEKKWVLLADEGANAWHDVRDERGRLRYRYKECVDEFEYKCKIDPGDAKETKFSVREKRIVTYNPALAAKQKREIRRMVERLEAKVRYREIVREELGDSAKYVNLEARTVGGEKVKIAVSLNQERIDEDMAFAGYNLLVTSETEADAREIYKTYHNLWRIEHSFRVMKTCLEARPVYVSDPNTIFGHFLVVYYSLAIMRLIEFKVFEDRLPIEQLFDFIRDYNVTENYDGSFVNNATDTPTYRAIKQKLGLSRLGNVYLTKKDLDNLFQTEF